jgi:DNA invertase Pin-like site-specific DNA recombinase/ribosomal protein L37AE/L43A
MAAQSRLALAYCRVSTRAQAEKWSLPAQRRALEEHATRQGWQYELLEETGSGETIADRPVFRAALERIAAGGVSILLVIDFDRLSRARNLADLELVKSICRAAGCRIATPGQTLDLGDADDDFLHTLFGALSAREKQKLLARQARGMAEAKASGRWHGGGVPTGYLYDREKKTIVPDPARADEVRLLLEGALSRGARSLREQFPTWSPTAIQRALCRQRVWWYAGRVLLEDGTTIPAAWEPLITVEQAQALHAARDHKRRVRDHSPQARRLLTGLGVWACGHCGTSMKSHGYTYRRQDGTSTASNYYRCNPWWVALSSHTCPNKKLIRCDLVDQAVLRAVWDAVPGLLAAARESSGADHPLPSPLTGLLEAAAARRDRLVAAVEDGTLTSAEARDRLTAARREIASLSEQVERAATPGPTEIPAELLRHLGRPPEKVPTAAAREVVRATCRRVELYDRSRLEITLKTGRTLTVQLT